MSHEFKVFDEAGNALSLAEVLAKLPTGFSVVDNCTRVEVIDERGRSYVNWKPDNKTKISVQDEGRTLKVFVTNQLPPVQP